MKNIIKADLYSQWKQKKIYVYALVYLVAYIIITSIGNLQWQTEIKVLDLFCGMLKQQYIMIVIGLLLVTCYQNGRIFSNKFVHIQVLGSKSRTKVLFSKYIVQSIVNLFLATCVMGLALWTLMFVYQTDRSGFSEVVKRYAIVLLLVVKYTIALVSVVFLVKNGVIAALLNWMIFIAEIFPFLLGNEYGNETLLKVGELFFLGQIQALTTEAITTELLVKILVTTCIEVSLYLGITVNSFKKTELL